MNFEIIFVDINDSLGELQVLSILILLFTNSIFFLNTNITSALEKTFNTKLRFNSLDIWHDYNNYDNPPHLDDSRIKLHLQIYLGDEENLGTSLYANENRSSIFHTFNYKCNSGYALLHNDHSWHGLESPIVNDRKSIYVRYQ